MHLGCIAEAQFTCAKGKYYKEALLGWYVYHHGNWLDLAAKPRVKLTPIEKPENRRGYEPEEGD